MFLFLWSDGGQGFVPCRQSYCTGRAAGRLETRRKNSSQPVHKDEESCSFRFVIYSRRALKQLPLSRQSRLSKKAGIEQGKVEKHYVAP